MTDADHSLALAQTVIRDRRAQDVRVYRCCQCLAEVASYRIGGNHHREPSVTIAVGDNVCQHHWSRIAAEDLE